MRREFDLPVAGERDALGLEHRPLQAARSAHRSRRGRGPRHGDAIEGMVLEGTPLAPLIDDLAHAVLAHRRSGREMPEALRVFADFFGPVPSGATPPPSDV